MFEYKIVVLKEPVADKHQEALNKLGKEGWELVSVIPIGKGGFGETSSTRAFFKRAAKQ